MKLLNLTLNNFGAYRGNNVLKLDNSSGTGEVRPVVLLGGKNGAGKTTVLEAIRLCLYGRLALGTRVSSGGYQDYLRAKVHRNENQTINPYTASVTLEFEHVDSDGQCVFEVSRKWDISGTNIKDFLEVKRDGQPLDRIDHENADEFLRELIPPGVSQLYFFDGEKIQDLAESTDDSALANAIKNLLGLELVERLNADLRVYNMRLASEEHPDIEVDNASLEDQANQINEDLRTKRALIDNIVSTRDKLLIEQQIKEDQLASEGGNYAKERIRFKEQIATHSARSSELTMQVKQHAEQLLPFAIIPELCASLKEQLQSEAVLIKKKIVGNLLSDKVAEIETAVHQHVTALLDDESLKTQITKSIKEVFAEVGKEEESEGVGIVHNLSEQQMQNLELGIRQVESLRPTLISLRDELKAEHEKLTAAERALGKAPKDDQLVPLKKKLDELKQELWGSDRNLEDAENELNGLERKKEDVERELGKLDQKTRELDKLSEKQTWVAKVQQVLSGYQAALMSSKTERLATCIQERLASLWRKGEKAKRVEVCPESFAVTLFDKSDEIIPRKDLSAGEKQMYAVAVLWALADVSERPLPLVIDTPLARLDSEHRERLVNTYFPNASHQVIVLSTDTEIDATLLEQLKPHLSHTVSVEHDIEEGETKLSEGYFWETEVSSAI